MKESMSPQARKCVQLLESRFGVAPDFAAHLLPILECCVEQGLPRERWERILSGVAAAYRSSNEVEIGHVDEVRGLLSQFVTEMQKLDENLKVLGVYLERVHQRLQKPTARRLLH